jgi:hypothetical protein
MPQGTSATFSRVERAGPSERHARPDRPPPSIDRWTGRISTNATSQRRHDGVRCAPEPIRSGRGSARLGWGAAGTLPRVAEGEVREDQHGQFAQFSKLGWIGKIARDSPETPMVPR